MEAQQEEILKRRAKEMGVSEAELIRRGLDILLARAEPPLLDPQAWEEERAFIHERAKIPAQGGERAWTRGELCDERLSR